MSSKRIWNNSIRWVGSSLPLSTPLHRYLPLNRAIQVLESRLLPLISPLQWWDPLEEFWATQQYVERGKLRRKSVFGSSWTIGAKNDALWQIYSKNGPAIRFRTTVGYLLTTLQNAPELTRGKIFVGKVSYLSDKQLKTEGQDLAKVAANDDVGRHLAKGLMMKRDAYEFEDELRVLWIRDKGSKLRSVSFQIDPKILFGQIRVDPREDEKIASCLSHVLSNMSGISDCAQSSLKKWKFEMA